MDGDDVLNARPVRASSSIRAILDGVTGTAEGREPELRPPGEGELLPKAGDAYKAHSRPSNAEGKTLHVMLADASYDGFAWSGFDRIRLLPPQEPGGGPVLVIRFAGAEIADVRIEGRNLAGLHNYLGQGRIAWIREIPTGKDFQDDAATVITRITIHSPTLMNL